MNPEESSPAAKPSVCYDFSGGYLATRTMLDHKVSTIHIKELLEDGDNYPDV